MSHPNHTSAFPYPPKTGLTSYFHPGLGIPHLSPPDTRPFMGGRFMIPLPAGRTPGLVREIGPPFPSIRRGGACPERSEGARRAHPAFCFLKKNKRTQFFLLTLLKPFFIYINTVEGIYLIWFLFPILLAHSAKRSHVLCYSKPYRRNPATF